MSVLEKKEKTSMSVLGHFRLDVSRPSISQPAEILLNFEVGEVHKYVTFVDLVKRIQMSIYYLLANFNIGVDTAENESSKVCQKVVRQLRYD